MKLAVDSSVNWISSASSIAAEFSTKLHSQRTSNSTLVVANGFPNLPNCDLHLLRYILGNRLLKGSNVTQDVNS